LKANKKKAKDSRSNDFIAPFDLFGVSARFFVDGRTRTLTWIGCLCSSILVGTILTLFVFQVRSHSLKSESLITTFETDTDSGRLFDLHASKQVFAVKFFDLLYRTVDWRAHINFKFYHVS
jgi:hypothetical protein